MAVFDRNKSGIGGRLELIMREWMVGLVKLAAQIEAARSSSQTEEKN